MKTGFDAAGLAVSADPLRVAVVEDYKAMRSLLVENLTANGFQVDGCADAAALWRHLSHFPCDLVVLDVGLPDEDGFSVGRRLRSQVGVAVVMLTGYASHEHQILGVHEGADAYLVKPVESHVLVATLNRIGRRLYRQVPGMETPRRLGWQLAEQGWLLRAPDQKDITLNAYERDLLHCLAAARGAPVGGDALLAALTRDRYPFDRRRLDQVVRRLRHKVAALSGYRLPLRPGPVAGSFQVAPFL